MPARRSGRLSLRVGIPPLMGIRAAGMTNTFEAPLKGVPEYPKTSSCPSKGFPTQALPSKGLPSRRQGASANGPTRVAPKKRYAVSRKAQGNYPEISRDSLNAHVRGLREKHGHPVSTGSILFHFQREVGKLSLDFMRAFKGDDCPSRARDELGKHRDKRAMHRAADSSLIRFEAEYAARSPTIS